MIRGKGRFKLIAKLMEQSKLFGIPVKYTQAISVIFVIVIEIFMQKNGIEPYLRFVFAGIVLISIIQYSLIYKNEKKREEERNRLEKLLTFMQIGIGVGVMGTKNIDRYDLFYMGNRKVKVECENV